VTLLLTPSQFSSSAELSSHFLFCVTPIAFLHRNDRPTFTLIISLFRHFLKHYSSTKTLDGLRLWTVLNED